MVRTITILTISIFLTGQIVGQTIIEINSLPYSLYPEVNKDSIELHSPFQSTLGEEYILALTDNKEYAIIPVSLSNTRSICPQLIIDSVDFPELTISGLHNIEDLYSLKTITGRTLEEINQLARPGALSFDGFLSKKEDILTVLVNDNSIVDRMEMTHPELAKPLFHVLNLMDEDLKLNRWNMAHHEWEHIRGFWYKNKFVNVRAYDTKGGQQSIFNDGITGAFHIKIWREPTGSERSLLQKSFKHLPKDRLEEMIQKISFINSGEMQPQYIMRYGFYEGHTSWRTDPIAIAYIFGLLPLEELISIFKKDLDVLLLDDFK